MAATGFTPIQIYYSTTASAVPTAGNLLPGELALNIADMKLYCENSSGVVTLLASASGSSGDVVGPASSTDNAIVRFDGTTGKLVQNSAVTIADDGTAVISVNSATDALRITQTGAGNALIVEDSTNPDATPFLVSASGNVLIGATALRSVGGGFQTTIQSQIFNEQIDTNGLTAYTTVLNRPDSNSLRVYYGRSRGTTVGSVTTLQNGDGIAQINFAGADGTTLDPIAARIEASVDGTPGTNDMPGRLVFSTTADGASSPTERMRITSAGTVGVGVIPSAGEIFKVGKNITGATTAFGVTAVQTISSDVTSAATVFQSSVVTQAAAFTLSNLYHFSTYSAVGAGSAITNQYGFFANPALTGATNNYGFYSNIASGTGRWNFFANGTADNAFAGNTRFGSITAPTVAVDVTGVVRAQAAATQDAVALQGRAGGTSSYAATITPTTLTANRTVTIPNEDFTVGFRNVPAVGAKTSAYILATNDVGKYVEVSTGGSIEIPNSTFASGDVVSIFNNTSAGITITCTITTAYIAGTDADKATVTLATRGVATILFISGTVCVITGNVS